MASSPLVSDAVLPERAGTPSDIAREALRQLASARLAPTPDNYARVYYEIAAPGERQAGGALSALREIATDLATRSPEASDASVALHRALDLGDWSRVRDVVLGQCGARAAPAAAPSLASPPIAPGAPLPPRGRPSRGDDAATWQKATEPCRVLLAEALLAYVTPDFGFSAPLVAEARQMTEQLRAAPSAAALQAVAAKLRVFLVRIGRAGEEHRSIQEGLLRLLQLLSANVSELLGDGGWMRGQVEAVAALTRGTLTLKAIAELESSLRDIAGRQGVLKQSLEQAKNAMKHMVATFIERIGELASNAGGYHDRLSGYCVEIEGAKDVGQLSALVVRIMEDTRGVQVDLGRSREELLAARRAVEQFQERTARLESELVMLSDRLQEDQLTRVLNRRGLSRVFAVESVRADRHRRALSLVMIDVDNFKALNDRLGHQAGDSALVHIAATIRASLRASDFIARYGGEEFVALLPETNVEQAMSVMRRVQRDLARNPFQYAGENVPITFSAGVAERVTGESEEALIARADRALYEAKKDGKNRLVPQ